MKIPGLSPATPVDIDSIMRNSLRLKGEPEFILSIDETHILDKFASSSTLIL